MLLGPFKAAVDLVGAFRDQEEAANQQDKVLSGDAPAEYGEQRLHEPNNPTEREEQNDAHHKRQCESDKSGTRLLLGRKLAGQDRYKYHIVDPEHELE